MPQTYHVMVDTSVADDLNLESEEKDDMAKKAQIVR